jgi:hypothetical protein
MIFADLSSHIQITLLNEAMAFSRNYFGVGENWLQQMHDVRAHVKEHLPDISDERLDELIFNAEQIYCQITHVPRQIFGMIYNRVGLSEINRDAV